MNEFFTAVIVVGIVFLLADFFIFGGQYICSYLF